MDIIADTKLKFAQFLETELEHTKPHSITEYAVRSMLDLLIRENADEVTEELIVQWGGGMLLKGIKPSTLQRYWRKLHALYQEWMDVEGVDPFVGTRLLIDNINMIEDKESVRNLSLLPRLFNKNEKAPEYTTICIFFYLLYNPQIALLDIPNLTFENAERLCPQIEDIIDKQDRTFGRKYLFPMRQGKASAAVLYRELTSSIGSLLKTVGFHFHGDFTRDSITAIWIAAAMRAGITNEEIRSIITAVPAEYTPLSIVEKVELSDADRQRIISTVANSINDNANRWFVMKLRPGVKFEDIKRRISLQLPERLSQILFYYPTHTVIRKEKKRTKKEEVPYLPDLLFFKTQRNKLKSLFAAIGDLAWCFRLSNAGDAPYSVIPSHQMTQFQRAIGQFTPDISLTLTRLTTPLPPGRRVRITGGLFAGYEGEILDVADESLTSNPLQAAGLTSPSRETETTLNTHDTSLSPHPHSPTNSSISSPNPSSSDPLSTPRLRTFYLRLTSTDIASWRVAIPDIFIEEIQ